MGVIYLHFSGHFCIHVTTNWHNINHYLLVIHDNLIVSCVHLIWKIEEYCLEVKHIWNWTFICGRNTRTFHHLSKPFHVKVTTPFTDCRLTNNSPRIISLFSWLTCRSLNTWSQYHCSPLLLWHFRQNATLHTVFKKTYRTLRKYIPHSLYSSVTICFTGKENAICKI